MASHNEAREELYDSEKIASGPSTSSTQQDRNFHTQHEKSSATQPTAMEDLEVNGSRSEERAEPQSMFKSLGILDRFLAVWIFLAMAVGIILGALVDTVGPALQKGEFVGVSVPIGMFYLLNWAQNRFANGRQLLACW